MIDFRMLNNGIAFDFSAGPKTAAITSGATVTFDSIERVYGSMGNDSFIVSDTDGVELINGAGGIDSYDGSALTAATFRFFSGYVDILDTNTDRAIW
jgi:hypothetical protein